MSVVRRQRASHLYECDDALWRFVEDLMEHPLITREIQISNMEARAAATAEHPNRSVRRWLVNTVLDAKVDDRLRGEIRKFMYWQRTGKNFISPRRNWLSGIWRVKDRKDQSS